jgi:FkbM family methyltransferase
LENDSVSSIKQLAKRVIPAKVWTVLRLARLQYDLKRFRARQVRHEYGGYPLDIRIEDPLAEGWYDHDWLDVPEIALLRQHQLRPGARVFDLGAHQCVVALMLARVVGPGGHVVALEASRHNAVVGQKNRNLNDAAQLTMVHAAASDRDGELVLNRGLNARVDDGSAAWGRTKVQARSVDSLSDEHGLPQVLFVDVEGFEVPVLRGAIRTLEALPDCFVEVHVEFLPSFGYSVPDVLSFFPENRYELFTASENEHAFRPLGDRPHLTSERFFLVAIARHD